MSKQWAYHKSEAPKIIDSDEWETYLDAGWADTPAAFINLNDMGVDPDDPVAVQKLGEAIETIKDEVNTIANVDIDKMTRKHLIEWAQENVDIMFPETISTKLLKKKVKEFVALSA